MIHWLICLPLAATAIVTACVGGAAYLASESRMTDNGGRFVSDSAPKIHQLSPDSFVWAGGHQASAAVALGLFKRAAGTMGIDQLCDHVEQRLLPHLGGIVEVLHVTRTKPVWTDTLVGFGGIGTLSDGRIGWVVRIVNFEAAATQNTSLIQKFGSRQYLQPNYYVAASPRALDYGLNPATWVAPPLMAINRIFRLEMAENRKSGGQVVIAAVDGSGGRWLQEPAHGEKRTC